MKDTLCIIGSHPKTRGQFDFNRTDCEIWVFNEAIKDHGNSGFAPRADAVFQMHEETIWRNPTNRNDPKHFEWLKSGKTPPIWMQEAYPEIPRAQRFPIEDVLATLLPGATVNDGKQLQYFTSSVDYALALAAYLHKTQGSFKRVELYGVEMETNTEYMYQRTGVGFWIGYLAGMGMEVSANCSIFDQPLYGYEGEVVLQPDTFEKRMALLKPQVEQHGAHYIAGMVNIRKLVDQFRAMDISKEFFPLLQKQLQMGVELGVLDGAFQENERYQKKAEAMKAQTEKFVFSRQEFESSAAALNTKGQQLQHQFTLLGVQLQQAHQSVVTAAKNSPKRKQLIEAYRALFEKYLQVHNSACVLQGAMQENYQYMKHLDERIRAAGGAKSEEAILTALKVAPVDA